MSNTKIMAIVVMIMEYVLEVLLLNPIFSQVK